MHQLNKPSDITAPADQPGLLAPDTSGMNFYRADPALTDLLRIGKMDAKQIRQRRIGAVEIHSRCIRREQPRLIGWSRYIARFVQLVHLQLLFIPPGGLDDIDHAWKKQAITVRETQ